ncbi:MAG TPA: 1-(5-phosphoribosyl)-5-[(5-phosphoribosylamino)methylideneamino] imidazole-4-carboxamide isomerase [Steroidobacteraceae bacterium]|jgi:phosphoribosylformimino-5-aminoimidazole carboxamide ribotide isomerase|nr:1-(5-phosphoribosyl)-5-[(5-phosphoribosylamino)methylideneamino] imidazole-4-carboxamide isomerase [Steroidobacteraceae bacterium]
MLLIPAIDLRGGACVRLLKGDFAAETRYPADAHELLARYRALGAGWLHLVDLDGARDGARGNHALIQTLAQQPADERPLRLQVGGGVRSASDIDALLKLGVARVVVGSAAAERPAEVTGWLQRHGPERICLAFDVRLDADGVPRVQTRGWRQATSLSLWDAVAAFADQDLRHVLCTDIDRDGALAGPNLALYREAQRRFPRVRWQASGGIAQGADLGALAATGVAAAISGKALLEQRLSVEELRPFLPNA